MIGWADVVTRADGSVVDVSSTTETPAIVFQHAITVPIAEVGRDVRAIDAFGRLYAIVKGQDTGTAIVASDAGATVMLGPTSGNYCVGLRATGAELVAVYVASAYDWLEVALDPNTLAVVAQRSTPLPGDLVGTSQGFLDLDAQTGAPLWTDLHRTRTLPNGQGLTLWMARGAWIIGQGNEAPDQVAAWDGATMFTVWQGATPFPPRLALDAAGTPRVGISADAPVFVPAPFGPYVTAPPPAPDVAPFGRLLGVLPFFVNHPRYGTGQATPGHGEVMNDGADAADRAGHLPVIADASVVDSVADGELYAVYVDSHAPDASQGVHLARARGVPVVLYHDAPDYPLDLLTRLVPGDVPCIQAYLRAGETLHAAEARLGATVAAVLDAWPTAMLAWMAYTQSGAIPIADVLAWQPRLEAIVRAYPAIVGVLPFAWARPSGCLDYAELEAWVHALVAASDGLPEIGADVDPPIDPPIDPVDPPFIPKLPRYPMSDTSEIHGVMFGGLYGRLDPADPLRIYFDQTTVVSHGRVEVTKPDDRYALRFVDANKLICFLGAPDAPIGSYVRCFETRPPEARGPSESPIIVEYPNGMIAAVVEYITDGRHNFSCNLTLVKQEATS